VARGYVKVTPRPVRTGVTNFFGNLGYTKTIGNDIFQGHPLDFGSDVARLVVNTTVGIGGVFDPATRFGLEKHDRDFGQTLGKWGVPTGAYLMLPLLGPSDVRDAFGLVPDRFMSVEGQINDPVVQAGCERRGQNQRSCEHAAFRQGHRYPPTILTRSYVTSGFSGAITRCTVTPGPMTRPPIPTGSPPIRMTGEHRDLRRREAE